MARRTGPKTATDEHEAIEELPSRLVFSLLQAAVRVAARVHMPLDRVTQLLRTAYFLEYRRRHPRDLSTVAERLDVSLRTAGTLNRQLQGDFFAPENRVEPLRLVTGALLGQPRSIEELEAAIGIEPQEIRRAVKHLEEVGWATVGEDGRVELSGSFRSFMADNLGARVDGVNHQMAIIADSVWSRFVKRDTTSASARSWAFAARREDVEARMPEILAALRGAAVEMEASALQDGVRDRYGITVAIAPLEDER